MLIPGATRYAESALDKAYESLRSNSGAGGIGKNVSYETYYILVILDFLIGIV